MVVGANELDGWPDQQADTTFAIATAFRGASDEDTRQVLNAMSHPAQVAHLTFYMLPTSWMVCCLPFLLGETTLRPTMQIENASLLSSGEVSDDDDAAPHEPRGRKPAEKKANTLRRDLVHRTDFYCVGSNVWHLISEKFGFDTELAFKVVSKGHGLLGVNLGAQEILIPASGHFDYRPVARPTDVVSDDDDDDDLFPDASGLSSRRMEGQPQDDTITSREIVWRPSPQDPKGDHMEFEKEVPHRTSTLKRKRYGSGLGNLGNTCFMSSTLQCLAHTEPLRRYFCSGEYEEDLNRDNPLGTGGELATQFAELLCEMWGSKQTSDSSYSSIVYPRQFKYILGKHAEQFLGYDQHDSQEFATYLLDALHEDTNRVTKKPYIEKPEQGEDEPDPIAAKKSWDLHLQREDSKVLENFMGQVKSRVQCPTCNRVSTTFDPFMYLSVPIPGATDRTLKVTFVPLFGPKYDMKITMPKTGTILVMQKKVVGEWKKLCGEELALADLLAVDVWNGEVYSFYKRDDEVDKIRDTDVTFLYQLDPSSALVLSDEDMIDSSSLPESRNRPNSIRLPIEDMTEINQSDEWKRTIDLYVKNMTLMSTLFNPKRATKEGLLRFYDKLGHFIDECYEALQEAEAKCADDDDLDKLKSSMLETVCDESKIFQDVLEVKDIARLEFAEKKLRAFIIDFINRDKNKYKDGLCVQVIFQRKESSTLTMNRGGTDKCFTFPICLRIPGSMTVYQLRELLAKRLPFKESEPLAKVSGNLKSDDSVEDDSSNVVPFEPDTNGVQMNGQHEGDLGLLIMRQIPMGFADQRSGSYGCRSSYSTPEQLGMLERLDDSAYDGPPVHLADASSSEERKIISDVVGVEGQIFLYWPYRLCDRFFDFDKYELAEQVVSSSSHATKQNHKVITVSNCIDKYCQMEQLEETEMWYCNKCKDHVRAWKQFHLYRTPPILIIHLKRFQYSASTHRRDKIDTFIDFPLTGLDLSKEVMFYNEDEKPLYDCYAVSNHYGGLGGGHYTAYALNDDGTWCYYDDSRITTDVDQKDVVSNAAYVLYYKRRDIVFETPHCSPPLPQLVQDSMGASTLVRVDSMDLDDRAVASSPPSSNTSTSAMPDVSPTPEEDYDSDSYPLPA